MKDIHTENPIYRGLARPLAQGASGVIATPLVWAAEAACHRVGRDHKAELRGEPGTLVRLRGENPPQGIAVNCCRGVEAGG